MQVGKLRAAASAVAFGLVFASGFGARADIAGFGDGTGFQINNNASGAASISAGTLNLTTNVGSQASSVFNQTAQNIGNFAASFTYTDVTTGGADGFAFVLQNDPRGATALGDGGGALGYGGAAPITPSAAVTFNLYSGNGGSKAGITFGGANRYASTGSVDITNGQPVNVTVSYAPVSGNNGVISTKLTQGANTFNLRPQAFNISALAGGNTGFVGFTGGTGGVASTQTISNFAYTTGAAIVPASYNVLQSTDTLTRIDGTQFTHNPVNDPNNDPYTPGNEPVGAAIDKNFTTKYLNFGGQGSGLRVTPAIGATIVTSLVLTSANDAPERDPASYVVRGSNDGSNFTDISSGAVPAFSGRFVDQELSFANSRPYTTYEVVFPTVFNSTANNSMQIGEVQLIGSAAVPEPGTFALLGLGVLPLLNRRRRA